MLLMLAAAMLFQSCGTRRIKEGDEVKLVFAESKYRSDKDYFRENQSGVSKDQSNAKKIAIQNARQALAASVQARVKMVIENYVRTMRLDNGILDENDMQELAYTIVNTQLSGVDIIGEKAFRLDDGSYRYHICIEVSKEAIEKALEAELMNSESLAAGFDKECFRKIFNEKME